MNGIILFAYKTYTPRTVRNIVRIKLIASEKATNVAYLNKIFHVLHKYIAILIQIC